MLKPIHPHNPDLDFDSKKYRKAYLLLDQKSTTKAYAYVLAGLRRIVTDKFDTMAVDGTYLYINPTFLDRLTIRAGAYVLAHESFHVMGMHHLRCGKRNPKGWNIATDAVINANLDHSFGGYSDPERPQGEKDRGIDMPWAIKMSAEKVYEKLKKENDEKKKQKGDGEGEDGEKSEEDSDGQGGGGGGDPFDEMEEQAWGEVIDRTAEMTEEEILQAEEKAKKILTRAIKAAKTQGFVPAHLEELVPDDDEVRVRWEDEFVEFANGLLPSDYCWHRPDLRYLGMGHYMPGVVKDGFGNIVILVDTSGSINQSALRSFASNAKHIVEQLAPEKVTVIYCDTKVQRVEHFDQGQDFQMQAKGGGGTCFRPAIDEAMNHDPMAIIYFTDLGASDYGAEPDVPFLWACYERWGNEPPYGRVIDIDR